MTKRDYYEVLEISKTATLEEVKKAYRKKALQYHPDKNPGDKESEELFKEATEAYSVVSDPDKRRKYDQFGHAAFQQGGMGGFTDFGDFSGFEDIFGDLFSSFFGGAATSGRRSRGRAGRDLRYDLELTFEEAVFGIEKNVTLSRRVACETCSGSGAAPGHAPETCKHCGGVGQVGVQQGFFTITRPCSICSGSGKIVRNPCADCRGAGLKAVDGKLNVKIPPGIDNGQRLKLKGEGEAGSGGGPSGDLYVHIAVKDHPIFERQESEIICEVPISYSTAALGDEIDVPTLDGTVKMKIPAGTQSGKIFRLRSKGAPIIGTNRRGDEHVRVVVKVPKKLSEEHRKSLEKLREAESRDVESETKSFFDKVKSLFG